MVLLKRLMWPRVGEDVIVYRHGNVMVEGHVTYAGSDFISIMDKNAETVSLDCNVLSQGIDDRSIVIKKKARTGPIK